VGLSFITPINTCMLDILEKYNRAVTKFKTKEEFNNWMITLGKSLDTPDPRQIRHRENFVKGCQNNAWLCILNNKLSFDSTSEYTKGMGKILLDVYSSAENPTKINFIDFRYITQGLSREEISGFSKMISKIHSLTKEQNSV